MSNPNWTILYNIVSPENSNWIGTGWEFFDKKVDAIRCYDRHNRLGNVVTLREYHSNDRIHLGAAHRREK